MLSRRTLLLGSTTLIAASVVLAMSSQVPFAGVFLVALAPTLFLVGSSGLVAGIVPTVSVWTRLSVFFAAVLVLGLNTYILALIRPLSKSEGAFPTTPLRLTPASWVHLDSNVDRIAGRVYSLGGPRISCQYFMCIQFNGIFMPRPNVQSEYWKETIKEELFKKGISLSGVGPPEAYLKVLDTDIGACRRRLSVELRDAEQLVVGTLTEDYRVCLPGAPPDGSEVGVFDYLRLSNPLAHFIAKTAGSANSHPMELLIKRSLFVDESPFAGTHVARLDIDVSSPEPAEPVSDAFVLIQAIRSGWDKSRCGVLMERRDIERGMQLMDPTYRKLRLDDIPVRLMRDSGGRLVGYTASSSVGLFCTDNAIHYLVSSPLSDGREQLQVFRFDRSGLLRQLIIASVDKPPNEQVELDLGSIVDDGTSISFALWYFNPNSSVVTRRQQISTPFSKSAVGS